MLADLKTQIGLARERLLIVSEPKRLCSQPVTARSRSSLGIEYLENFVAIPAVPGTHPFADFREDAVAGKRPQDIAGTGLAQACLRLDVANGDDGVGEQQVYNLRRTAPITPEACAEILAEIGKHLGAVDRIVGLDGDAIEEEVKSLRDLAALADVLKTVVVLALPLIEVARQV